MTRPAPERIGRYRIVSELGRGAMGVVYRGHDEALDRSVAIKTIVASMDEEEQAGYLARFRQEARALGGLNHPSIITVHEFGDENGLAYLAMELLEGRELRDLIRAGAIDLSTAVEIAAQVAEGLAFAHARGIVHRDVKPGNVMVLEGARAKIMDFGIARVRASDVKTQTGLVLGSPKYMSPEQVVGRPVDNRSDVFSLGVVLHEMLAGAAPFSGEDIHQLMYQVCNARPALPSTVNPAVPRTLDLIVSRALEKEPGSRYQDASEMAADLRASLAELRAGGAAPSDLHAATVTQRASPVIERTQAIGAATSATPPVNGLHVSRRFQSDAAVARLAESSGADRLLLSPESRAPSLVRRLLLDGVMLGVVIALLAAAALAVFLARSSG